jgi:hypothetical protein
MNGTMTWVELDVLRKLHARCGDRLAERRAAQGALWPERPIGGRGAASPSRGRAQEPRRHLVQMSDAIVDSPNARQGPVAEPDKRAIAIGAIAIGVQASFLRRAMKAARLRNQSTAGGTGSSSHRTTVASRADANLPNS